MSSMRKKTKYRGPFAKLSELKDRLAAATRRRERSWKRCKQGMAAAIRAEQLEKRLARAIEREIGRMRDKREETKRVKDISRSTGTPGDQEQE